MVDGVTDRLQQFANRGSPEPADHGGLLMRSSEPMLRNTRLAHDRGVSSPHYDRMHRCAFRHTGRLVGNGLDETAMCELVDRLRHRQAEAQLDAWLDELMARGLPVEHIYLRLFQPVARRLGELWAEDICSFVEVTLAMALLQSGLRRLSPRFQQHGRSANGARSVFLVTLSNDQHTFGLSMTAEFFRRSGWTVCMIRSDEVGGLACRVLDERNAVVGFSASRIDQLPELAAAIRQLRRAGRDRIAGILVGGPLFVTSPDCARVVGADAIGLDARQALAEAESLVAAGDRW